MTEKGGKQIFVLEINSTFFSSVLNMISVIWISDGLQHVRNEERLRMKLRYDLQFETVAN